jgi:nucleoporin POM152
VPISIEIFRLDFDTNANETIEIKQKEIRAMRKQADKKTPKGEILTLEYPIKKPGLYRLLRVVDESKLDVQRRISDTLVVKCPRASMKPSTTDRCIGDLSDLTIDVEGIPPLKIAYSRTINSKDQSFHLQSIQPENLVSPLTGSSSALTLISRGNEDISWAKSQLISVRLNESTTSSGKWLYSIDEVHDATGNVANFSARGEDGEHIYPKGSHLEQGLTVHERPQVRLEGCDSNKALRVAKGKSTAFPIRFGPLGRTPDDAGHVVTWEFSPIDTLTAEGGHGSEVVLEEFVSKNAHQKPNIERPGLYTIKSVRNQFCEGEVREPASCLLINPPEPDLTITSEDIYDKCAGSSIGLRLDLDLIGTPPFTVYYEVEERNSRPSTQRVEVSGSRHQLELKPETAGHFTYRFTRIDDQVYRGHALNPKDLTLEQDVKPPASAHLMGTGVLVEACIGEPVKLDIFLSGEPPFTLEYELLHDGKRVKQKLKGLDPGMHEISTGPLLHGGAYSLALTSVQDSTGCKIFLNQEVKIRVRPSRPKVSFGQVEGKRSTLTLEGREIELPLRLEGVSPWKVSFRNVNDSTGKIVEREVNSANGNIKIDTRGTYELVSVNDATCPGTVEASASTFDVGWIARPELKISNLSGVIPDGKKYVKREVCESDVDSMEVNLIGKFAFVNAPVIYIR